jgi:hypothetical protein
MRLCARAATLLLIATVGAAVAGCSSGDSSSPSPTAAPLKPTAVFSSPEATRTLTARAARTPTPFGAPPQLVLASSAFASGETIPVEYTCSGKGTSPPLTWTDVPAGTAAFALTVDDADAPRPGGFFDHWVVFDFAPTMRELPAGATLPAQAVSGKNGAGAQQYIGPCPPPGSAEHHYRFHLYALDTPLNLPPGSSKDDVLAATAGHILGEAELVGLFKR